MSHTLTHARGGKEDTHHDTYNANCKTDVLQCKRPAIHHVITNASNYLDISGGFGEFCA